MSFDWSAKRVLVTGGASFIGSHLVDALLFRGSGYVRVVDNLSSGKLENLAPARFGNPFGTVDFIQGDLRATSVAQQAVEDIDIVFHLAADHGGRGYVDTHQAGPASNLLLDGMVFQEAVHANVDKIVYASSGCVYPNFLQADITKELYLTEDMVGPPHDADNMYGWAKLMGEKVLTAYAVEHNIRAVSCRYFTVYGPRGKEDHAVIAMIARAFVEQDPYLVWGDGTQIRNWTYIDDIVEGTILAAESDGCYGTAINLGTMERTSVLDAVHEVLSYTDHRPVVEFLTDMPTGPLNRVASNELAKELLGWEPQVSFREGVRETIDWYFNYKDKDEIEQTLNERLLDR